MRTRPRTSTSQSSTAMVSKYLVFLLLLLLLHDHHPASSLQTEHNLLDRAVGTSFDSSASTSGKKVQMQVCITIGCCHHVCRQFIADTTSELQAQLKQATLAPFASQSSLEPADSDLEEDVSQVPEMNENVAVVPSVLEWNPRFAFSPSIKYLSILNTGNTSWINTFKPVSTDEQFIVQEIETRMIAPGERLTIPVMFLPRKSGTATGRIILQTSAGRVGSWLRGEGLSSPYQLRSSMGPDYAEGKSLQHRISFHNPHDEAVEITEVQVWPQDSYNKALCLSEEMGDKITSCFADNFSKAILSGTRYEKYSHQGSFVELNQLDSWKIQSQKTAQIVEVETTVQGGAWSGLVYMKFSRNSVEEVMILPLEMKVSSSGCALKESEPVEQPTQTRQENAALKLEGIPVPSGKWTQTNDQTTLKIAKSLLKDLAHTLLRQPERKKGSLSASRKEPMLVSGELVKFPMVQTGLKQNLWIHLVNPSPEPVVVNLILPLEVKSRDCKYRGNWFWQGQRPQVHRHNKVFSFEAGALTEAILPGKGELELGPLTFQPKHKCEWSGFLFVKNNLTGLEWIPLSGTGGSANLLILDNDVTVKKLDMVIEDRTGNKEETCHSEVQKTFQVKNMGDLPLQVHGIDLTDASRITLGQTDGFSLAVDETADMLVSYKPDFQAAGAKQMLKLATSIGVIKLQVVPKLPRDLIALCKNSPFHERAVLPVSICALILVLGIFVWLLLQELLPERAVSKPDTKISAWKKTWNVIPRFWIVKTGAVKKPSELSKFETLRPIVTLQTFHQELPRSQGSSSGPASPYSGSESEMQTPPIERILISSRFSEARTSPQKSKSRITLSRKEVVINQDIQAALSAKLELKISSSNKISKMDKTKTKVAAINLQQNKKSTSCGEASVTDDAWPPSAAAPPSARAPGRTKAESQKVWKAEDLTGNSSPTSIAHPQMENANEPIHQQSENVYDIWGDHFAEIFRGPGSPHHFTGSNQSLFSQSLPTSTQQVRSDYSGSNRFAEQRPSSSDEIRLPRAEDLFDVLNDFPLFNVPPKSFGFLPTIDALSEPPFFDWNNDPIYRTVVPQLW